MSDLTQLPQGANDISDKYITPSGAPVAGAVQGEGEHAAKAVHEVAITVDDGRVQQKEKYRVAEHAEHQSVTPLSGPSQAPVNGKGVGK